MRNAPLAKRALLLALATAWASACAGHGVSTRKVDGFTHVVSTFVGNSSEARLEAELVQKSWLEAAATARASGINVELINVIVAADEASDLVDREHRVIVLDSAVPNLEGHTVPAVGDIFARASAVASFAWVVYTNADIAMGSDFFVKLARLIEEHADSWLDAAALRQKLDKVFENLRYCLSRSANSCPISSIHLCLADAMVFFEESGAGMEKAEGDLATAYLNRRLLDLAKRKPVARGGCGPKTDSCFCRMMSNPATLAEVSRVFQARVSELRSLRVESRWIGAESADELAAIAKQIIRNRRNDDGHGVPVIAGTITRVNIPSAQAAVAAAQAKASKSLAPLGVEARKSGVPHPGNDCFFFHRDHLPDQVASLRHPIGMRPWGMWIPSAFRSASHRQLWLRVAGRRAEIWTLHLDVSENVWRSQARANGPFLLDLAANWFKVSQYQFGDGFVNIPTYCRNIRHWRSKAFCSVNPSYCHGSVRLACAPFQFYQTRDTQTFLRLCRRQAQSLAVLDQPQCDFCNFLLHRALQFSEAAEGHIEPESPSKPAPSFDFLPCSLESEFCKRIGGCPYTSSAKLDKF